MLVKIHINGHLKATLIILGVEIIALHASLCFHIIFTSRFMLILYSIKTLSCFLLLCL